MISKVKGKTEISLNLPELSGGFSFDPSCLSDFFNLSLWSADQTSICRLWGSALHHGRLS